MLNLSFGTCASHTDADVYFDDRERKEHKEIWSWLRFVFFLDWTGTAYGTDPFSFRHFHEVYATKAVRSKD